jgi:hypothetical protein
MSGESEDELTLAEVARRISLRRAAIQPLSSSENGITPLSSRSEHVAPTFGEAPSPGASRKRPREPSGRASRPSSPDRPTELAKAARPLLLSQEVADSVIAEQLFNEAGNVQTALATALVTASALKLDRRSEDDGGRELDSALRQRARARAQISDCD